MRSRRKLAKLEYPQLRDASNTLLANIRFASIGREVKTIVVTSSGIGEGKTMVSTNLACAIASSGERVLLVEADLRRRCLANLLGIHPKHGLCAALSETAPLHDVIVRTKVENLYFLDAESDIPNPSDIFSSKQFASLVETLREVFDYVIFDTPPVIPFVEAALIGNIVDGALFVVRQKACKRSAAIACVQQMKAANACILGTVMTSVKETQADYYAYYTREGSRVRKNNSDQ